MVASLELCGLPTTELSLRCVASPLFFATGVRTKARGDDSPMRQADIVRGSAASRFPAVLIYISRSVFARGLMG